MAYGCATTPERPLAESRIFQIEGIRYLPLSAVAKLNDMNLMWDAKKQKADLTKQNLHLRLRVGSAVVVANGETHLLDHPVLLHHGRVVVPVSFTKVLERFFTGKEISPFFPPYRIQTVIVDAGHGGHDMGAVGQMGLKEKQVNLDIARRLKEELEGQGLQVIMTRKEDDFISLYHRTYIANRAEGNFFVSIHCNASRNRDVDGFEVYHVPPALEESGDAMASAEASPEAPFYGASAELARSITSAMEHRLSLPNRGIRSARFFVLKEVKMPAVLVEVGYISNASEEALLEEKSHRQDIAEAVAEGILAYKQGFEREESLEHAETEEAPADRDF